MVVHAVKPNRDWWVSEFQGSQSYIVTPSKRKEKRRKDNKLIIYK